MVTYTKKLFVVACCMLASCLFVQQLRAAFDLQVVRSANKTYVHTGDIVSYTITLSNAGASPSGYFVLREALDTNMTYQNDVGGSCTSTGSTYASNILQVHGISLSAGASCTVTYSAQASTGQDKKNWLLVPGKILSNYQVANTSRQTITFDRTYNSTPVVIATPVTASQTNNYPLPVIRNVSRTGFQFAMCIDAGATTCMAQATGTVEDFHYFVVNKDLATQYAWADVKTGIITTAGADTALSFNKTFANVPIIWASSQTYGQTGGISAAVWVDDTTTSQANFIGCVHRGTANSCQSGRPNETVGYVAFDLLNTILPTFISGFQNITNSSWTSITYTAATNPYLMVTVNDDNGANDPKYPRAQLVTTTGAQIRYCKQGASNVCNTTHPAESTNWFRMDGLPKREITSTATLIISGTDSNPADNSGATTLPQSYCGNGIVDLDETCDDANTNNGDSCVNSCGVCVDADNDGSCAGTDCNDNDNLQKPGQVWYRDYDGDDYSNGTTLTQCARPTDYYVPAELIATTGDCNDADAWIKPTTIWYKDTDGDLFGDGTTQVQCARPTNYALSTELTATNTDCNDSNAAINPNTLWYKDLDVDHYSDGTSIAQCARPTNYYLTGELTSNSGDCNDTVANEYPGQIWYIDADLDHYSNGTTTVQCTRAANSFLSGELTAITGDCNDTVANEHPGQTWYKDIDGDHYSDGVTQSQCSRSTNYYLSGELTALTGDCVDTDALQKPGQVWYKDLDSDRYGDNTSGTQCARPTNYYVVGELISSQGDCDDTNANKNPAQAEVCDLADNNCNNQIDEGGICLQTFCSLTGINIPNSECLALQALFNNLNGASWGNNTNWLANSNVGTWYGIGLATDGSGNKHVGSITLENNGLIGSFPSEVSNLPYLTGLILNDNTIVSFPAAIDVVDSLSRLELKNNSLSSLPNELGGATGLQILLLDGNDLSVLPNSITQLNALVTLSAPNNQLTSLPATLGNLTNLSSLLLENNQITTVPTSIAQLATLDILDLDYNQLTTLPSLATLTDLDLLSLGNNSLTSLPSDIGTISGLDTLYVNNNQLTSLPDSFGSLTRLHYLYAGYNQITTLPSTIGTATGMIIVDLRNNALTSLPDVLGALDAITTLYLQNNLLTTTPNSFGYMGALNTLYIHDNLLTSLPDTWSTLAALRFLYAYNNPLMVGTIPSTYAAMTLFRFYIYNNALDRLVNPTYYAKVPTALSGWFTTIPVKLYGNQGDITAPVLTGNLNLSMLYMSGFNYTFTITENAFAVNASGTAMSVAFTGGALCSNLSSTGVVSSITGSVTIPIQVAATGLYVGCQLQVTDHGGNASNWLTIDTFVYGTQQKEMCLHPEFTVPQAECEALVLLYQNTNGGNWRNKANWLLNGDVESWFGVRTNVYAGAEHVDGLFLHKQSGIDEHGSSSLWQGNRLVGSLPDELGNLTELRDLNLSTNSLTGSIPAALGNATHMVKFYALRNTLGGEIPSTFGAMTGLQILHLSTNKLSGVLPSQIGQMSSLQALDLSENLLTGALPSSLGNLANMRFLKLNNNSFAGTIPSQLGNATALQYLYLGNNSLLGTLPSTFTQLTALSNLYAQTNYLDRTNTHDAMIPTTLTTRYNAIGAKDLSNQGDVTPPILANTGSINAVYTGAFILPVEINENSYAVSTQGVGMSVAFSGNALCLALPATTLSQRQGLGSITLDPNEVGLYSGCLAKVTDHGTNVSNRITIPSFSYTDAYGLICYAATISIPQSECLALASFFKATAGDTWTNNTNWTTTTGVNTWFGVQTQTIGSQNHVTSIQLPTNNLSGTIPLSIGNLPFLQTLSLNNNSLTNGIPTTIGILTGLVTLQLADNQLNGTIPNEINNITALQTLNISGNAIGGVFPFQTGSLTQMRNLIINDNQFTGTIPTLLSQMTSLLVLNIANNDFVGLLPSGYSALTALTTLYIQGNNLDRDASHNAVIPASLTSRYTALATKSIVNQGDIISPVVSSTGTLAAIITGTIVYPITIVENSYAVNGAGQGMNITFGGTTKCAALTTATKVTVKTGSVNVSFVPTSSGNYLECVLTVTDHAGNSGSVIMPDFVYQLGCGDGVVQANEYCDDGGNTNFNDGCNPSCQQTIIGQCGIQDGQLIPDYTNDGALLTPDSDGLCTSGSLSGFAYHVANHSRTWLCDGIGGASGDACNATGDRCDGGDYDCNEVKLGCGDGTTDANGIDNILGTSDDEACDEGSKCNNGTVCTNNPGLCPGQCRPRLVNNCNSSCEVSRCGDRYLDTNGIDETPAVTYDDEACDLGSYCNNGTDCSRSPSLCANGQFECRPRSLNGCSPTCKLGSCGDGYVDPNGADDIYDTIDDEKCDDSNLTNGDGCSSTCKTEYCGDGYRDSNGPNNDGIGAEECDLGLNNGILGGVCSSTCTLPNDECVFCYEVCDGGTGLHNIFMLIDVSGSMGDNNKLANAKAGAINFVNLIESGATANSGFTTKIGLIKFSDAGTIVENPTLNYTQLKNSISALTAGGGTNFGDPIQKAIQYFVTNPPAPGYKQSIVLLSDGQPTVGGSAPYTDPGAWAIYQSNQAKANNIAMYTIALDLDDLGVTYLSYMSSSTKLNQARRGPGFNKPVTQSTTAPAGATYCDGFMFFSLCIGTWVTPTYSGENALDENMANYSLTTEEYQAWWQVNMNNSINIEKINVWNRTTETNETSNFWVSISQDPFATGVTLSGILADANIISYYTTGEAGRPTIIPMTTQGQYVRVTLNQSAPGAITYSAPSTLSGLKIWLDGKDIDADGLTNDNPANSGTVGSWLDKSGNGRNAIITSGITYRTTSNLGAGLFVPAAGTVGIKFTGSNITTGTIIYVTEKDGSDVDGYILRGESSSNYFIGAESTRARELRINAAPNLGAPPAVTATNTDPHIYHYETSTGNYTFRDAGNFVASGAANSSSGIIWTVNSYGNGTSNTTDSDVVVAEFIEFSRILTQSEREMVEGYLANKRGLLSQLPDGHPYKPITNTTNLGLAEVEIFGCDITEATCTDKYHYKDYGGITLNTLYGHVFGSIHCDCSPEEVCGICGDGYLDNLKGEQCDEGSYCDDWNGIGGTSCTHDPTVCASQGKGECRPRYTDGCTNACKTYKCGDGLVEFVGSGCLDTNGYTGSFCTASYDCGLGEYCAGVAITGNYITSRICLSKSEITTCMMPASEECDDSNSIAGDGCSSLCRFEECGDGLLDESGPDDIFGTSDDEECDDGNAINGDNCTNLCRIENKCGDLYVDANGTDNLNGNDDDESCDEGMFCDVSATVACISSAQCINLGYPANSCKTRYKNDCTPECKSYGDCGDGVLDIGEQCDLGMFCNDNVTACSSGQVLTGGCGACDRRFHGNCTASCQFTHCGDGVIQTPNYSGINETCDDGNAIRGDGCSHICGIESCGDGYADPDGPDNILGNINDETCDDGNHISNDGCSSGCRLEHVEVCGDGLLNQVSEQCDDGNLISTDGCSATCQFEMPLRVPMQIAPSCLEGRLPTIMKDEILPLWWTITPSSTVDVEAKTCDQVAPGKHVPGQSLLCRFVVLNGLNPINGAKTISNVPCMSTNRSGTNGAIFADLNKPQQFAPILGNTYLSGISSWVGSGYGQYRIILDQVKYTYCNSDAFGASAPTPATITQSLCEMRATVAKGYLLQKGVGLSAISNSDLSNFNDAEGTGLAAVGTFGDEDFVATNSQQSVLMDSITESLVEKYTPQASIAATLLNVSSTTIKKVPNENIYVYEGTLPLTISDQLLASDVPFTLIVTQADLVVEGSLEGKGMFVVPNGTITFANEYCDDNDLVRGIFIAGDGFTASAPRNDTITQADRCYGGRLSIEGLLIGGGIDDTFAEERRAAVDLWDPNIDMFNNQGKVYGHNKYLTYQASIINVSTSYGINVNMQAINNAFEMLDVNMIDTLLQPLYPNVYLNSIDRQGMLDMKATHNQTQKERRNVLFDGSSVLIKTNPSLWQELPPGAADYWAQLSVTKYED